jgi:DNA modification methylase
MPRAKRNDILPHLELTYLPLGQLRPTPKKLRKLDPVHVREIAAAIAELGFCDPILIGKENLVLHGEARLEAAKLHGLERVPCIQVAHLSDKEQRVLRLAVNRLAEKGDWDLDQLKIEFEELIIEEAPIEVSGFTLDQIDQIINADEADVVEQGPLGPNESAVAIARPGDVFGLGPHRVVCGNATDPAVLRLLMGGDYARLILTDEPYKVATADHAMASGEMTADQFLAFNLAWIEAAAAYLCDGGVFGTFIDWRGQLTVHAAATKLGLEPLNLIVWVKTNAGMGSLYRSRHELLPLFKKGAAPHVNNVDRGRSNVWTYRASSLGSRARHGLQDHPTVKPIAMLEDAFVDVTNRGEIVIDPFLGSGSSLVAADKTGRICRGVELDPLYVDVIIRRYQAATADHAVLVETGETFEALAARREREAG